MFSFFHGHAPAKKYRIGVDVGGTNTDAVLLLDSAGLDQRDTGIIAFCKTETTVEVAGGIEYAIKSILEESRVDVRDVAVVTVGTTHFLNAVLQGDAKQLDAVAVLRLSSGFTTAVPPFSDWPSTLRSIIYGYHAFCKGGCNIDGSESDCIDVAEIKAQASHIKSLGLHTIVVTGVYSPADESSKQESSARDIILSVFPDASVVCSSEIGSIGLLERENASILNASILRYARRTISGFRSSLGRLHLECPLYLTQNNGTIMNATIVSRMPIKTFSSGPTNSMRGAAYLYKDELTSPAIVLDIGGTTCDGGVLLPSGVPREAASYTMIAGVRVNYPMPFLYSVALGGGSIVKEEGGIVQVGPESVGQQFTTSSRIFGGSTTTISDIAVHLGQAKIGDNTLVSDLKQDLVRQARERIESVLQDQILRLKTSPGPVLVLLVGGGSVIVPTSLPGVDSIIRPKHHDIANAIGAAIAKVSGHIDKFVLTEGKAIAEVIGAARAEAITKCIANGADSRTVSIVDQQVVPVQYTQQIRIVVTAIGDLLLDNRTSSSVLQEIDDETDIEQSAVQRPIREHKLKNWTTPSDTGIDLEHYCPLIDSKREWLLSELDIELLSKGCYVLGCAGMSIHKYQILADIAGGGSPYAEYLQLRGMLRDGHILRVAEVNSLQPDSVVLYGGHMGSPAVSVERLSANEFLDAATELLHYWGKDHCAAVMGLEIGGGNGLQPLLVGSSKNLDVPYLDADWMGRAFPTYYQTTLCIYLKNALVPAAISTGNGNSLIMTKARDDKIVDVALRAACTEMGSRVGMAAKPVTVDLVQQYAIQNTVSLAWRIGRAIVRCQTSGNIASVAEQIIEEVGGPKAARKLFCGRIIEVETCHNRGHSFGSITIAPSGDESAPLARPDRSDGLLRLPYKNEIILAEHESTSGTKEVLVTVPDLICVLDAATGEALGVPEFRYGLRVIVLAMAASPHWTHTVAGLALAGPAAFGYHNVEYRPLGEYVEPRSVIEEFAGKA